MKLFLDANVLFTAAHNPKGKASLIIELGIQGQWALCTSRYAVEEATRNLERKYPDCLERLGILVSGMGLVEHQRSSSSLERLAEKDQPILQAALACEATHLLTGDLKDFGPFMNRPNETHQVLVQTVADF